VAALKTRNSCQKSFLTGFVFDLKSPFLFEIGFDLQDRDSFKATCFDQKGLVFEFGSFFWTKRTQRPCDLCVKPLKIGLSAKGFQPKISSFEFVENWTHILIISNPDENPGDSLYIYIYIYIYMNCIG